VTLMSRCPEHTRPNQGGYRLTDEQRREALEGTADVRRRLESEAAARPAVARPDQGDGDGISTYPDTSTPDARGYGSIPAQGSSRETAPDVKTADDSSRRRDDQGAALDELTALSQDSGLYGDGNEVPCSRCGGDHSWCQAVRDDEYAPAVPPFRSHADSIVDEVGRAGLVEAVANRIYWMTGTPWLAAIDVAAALLADDGPLAAHFAQAAADRAAVERGLVVAESLASGGADESFRLAGAMCAAALRPTPGPGASPPDAAASRR
jgi:hypothetical protein